MDRDRELLRHFLAAIAYRTQKALRGAPEHYAPFSAGNRYADIRADRFHADQPPPARPDKHWPEKPE